MTFCDLFVCLWIFSVRNSRFFGGNCIQASTLQEEWTHCVFVQSFNFRKMEPKVIAMMSQITASSPPQCPIIIVVVTQTLNTHPNQNGTKSHCNKISSHLFFSSSSMLLFIIICCCYTNIKHTHTHTLSTHTHTLSTLVVTILVPQGCLHTTSTKNIVKDGSVPASNSVATAFLAVVGTALDQTRMSFGIIIQYYDTRKTLVGGMDGLGLLLLL